MANMFSGRLNKQVPRTLAECTETDETVSNLHTWAERLETWGKIVFIILITVGVLDTIISAVAAHELLESSFSRNELIALGESAPSVGEVVIKSLLTWAFYAFLEYCVYHVLALLISALATITQNTTVSANVALYKCSNATQPSSASTPTKETNRPVSTYTKPVSHTPAPENMWTCKNCGTHNKNEYGQCKKCGQYRT